MVIDYCAVQYWFGLHVDSHPRSYSRSVLRLAGWLPIELSEVCVVCDVLLETEPTEAKVVDVVP